MTDSKEHYKLHKSGKQWVAILVTTVGVGAGLAIQPQFVHAGTTATADNTSQNVQPIQSSSNEPAAETSKSATVKPAQVTSGQQSATNAQPARAQPKTSLVSDPQSGVTLSLNRTQVGYGQSLSPLTLTVHLTAKAGDVFKITVPKSTVTLRPVVVDQFQSAAVGTVAQTDNGDGTVTITDTIAQAGNYTQVLSYSPITNAQALQSNQAVAAPQGQSYTATAGLNGSAQTSAVSFTESVTPTAKISPVTRVAPDAAKTPKVQANTNYVYQFQVDQSNGVHDDTATQRVNSTFNVGGTTVTIPAPADFLLDSAQTRAINGFGEADGTTITQPAGKGGDIVLTVPANSPVGNANQPYRLVGQYALASGGTLGDEIVTRPITFTQDEGTSTFTAQSNAATTWADTVVDATIAPNANTHGLTNYSLSAGGNSGKIPAQLVKDDDADNDPEYVATFGFSHLGAANDVAPTAIKMTIPDGLKVTGVQLPAAGTTLTQYLPGTTSYHYLLTFADGTTKEGDQAAGTILKTTTGGAVVRAVTLTPNFLAAGATSGPTGIGLIGKVAALYGDRVNYSVFIGDTMTTTINAVGGQTSSSFTQTVSAPLDEPQLYNSRQSSQPGAVADVEDVNTLSGLGGDVDEIWEPNFYWVVDKAFTVKVNAPGAMVWSRDTPDGTKTVVTISYSGKGYFKSNGMGNLVTISNAPDAVNGTYHIQTYVFSARTKFPSTATNYPVVSPEFAAQTGMNDTAVNFGYREWPISSIAGTYATYLAQGDDPTPQPTGSIDKNSKQPLTFYTNVINTTDETKDTAVLLNLPQTGDGQGSQYPFKLKGPISLPAQLQSTTTGGATTSLQNAQVL